MDSLNYLLEHSDYLVLSAALTDETTHVLNKSNLTFLKSSAVIINVGRGGLVEEEALIECLMNARIHGAALDCFNEEPLPPDSPFWDLPNVLISPHNAFQVPEIKIRAVRFSLSNCNKFILEEELSCIVNKADGY
jgi:phosphoglycerate dehydrogenase-like enzyme